MSKLAEALLFLAAHRSADLAFQDEAESLTWQELVQRVGGTLPMMERSGEVIGIAGGNGVAWVIAFLGAWVAGKTIVPIPTFFSKEQVAGVLSDAQVRHVIAVDRLAIDRHATALRMKGVETILLPDGCSTSCSLPLDTEGRLIIHTSGTTGRPKGVRLFSGQAMWVANALAEAVQATEADCYLSLLPLSMLLEIICAIFIPVLVGGRTFLASQVADAAVVGVSADIAGIMARVRPSRTVMTPQLLGLYARQLLVQRKRPPESLTFVAVGGAPLPMGLARAATEAGIPFFEGYGLSECSSVVSLNLPGRSRVGTVGRPLPGLHVEIQQGEIVVSGPSVMDGYVQASDCQGRWHTGDLGTFDTEGYLRILGRKDNLLVTSTGRNISPEWIEAMVLSDARISACVLLLSRQRCGPGMLIIPSRAGQAWFDAASELDIVCMLQRNCAYAPVYARPQWTVIISRKEAEREGLLGAGGALLRRAAAHFVNRLHQQQQTCEESHGCP